MDIVFWIRSLLLLAEVMCTAIVGGAIGICTGKLLCRHSIVAQAIANFLRLGMWIPVLFLWAIPVVLRPASGWTYTLLGVLITTNVAVAMATLRDYIIQIYVLKIQSNDALRSASRAALIQSLIVVLFAQPMLSVYGWHWYIFRGTHTAAAIILICLLLFIIEHLFQAGFEECSLTRARILLIELSQITWSRITGATLFGLLLVFIWQLLALAGFYRMISSPVSVLTTVYTILGRDEFWIDIYDSNLEIFAGIAIAVGIGIVCNWVLLMSRALRRLILELLPLTFITPIMASLSLVAWFQLVYPWPKIVGIALLSVFPSIRAFWGLRDRPLGMRILMGWDETLPFAFVAMLFGESMASTSGLGFSLAKASVTQDRSGAIALVFVIILLMAIISWILRLVAKYCYAAHVNVE